MRVIVATVIKEDDFPHLICALDHLTSEKQELSFAEAFKALREGAHPNPEIS